MVRAIFCASSSMELVLLHPSYGPFSTKVAIHGKDNFEKSTLNICDHLTTYIQDFIHF